MKALVIDDEMPARENLKLLLHEFCEGIEVIDTAGNITEAKQKILALKPEVIFLDIRMPSGAEGFDLLDSFDQIDFKVVFVTAFKDYAIQAFKANAIDYILKPVEIEELQKTVQRLTESTTRNESSKQQIDSAFESIRKRHLERIAIPHQKGIKIVQTKDIIRLESRSNYTILQFLDGSEFLDTRTLKIYQDMLPVEFLRVHNSHMVNSHYITDYIKEDGHIIILSNGDQVPVSRSNIKEVQEFIQSM